MSELTQTFQNFIAAKKAMDDFQLSHKDIFAQHRALGMNILDTQMKLEDAVVLADKGISNADIEVKLIPQTQTFADITVIDDMIKAGKIAPGLRDEIVKTIARPPHISIKPVQ